MPIKIPQIKLTGTMKPLQLKIENASISFSRDQRARLKRDLWHALRSPQARARLTKALRAMAPPTVHRGFFRSLNEHNQAQFWDRQGRRVTRYGGHDVSDEPRDAQGQWTKGGAVGKTNRTDASQAQPKRAPIIGPRRIPRTHSTRPDNWREPKEISRDTSKQVAFRASQEVNRLPDFRPEKEVYFHNPYGHGLYRVAHEVDPRITIPDLVVPDLRLTDTEDFLALLEHGSSLQEQITATTESLSVVDDELRNKSWIPFPSIERRRELNETRAVLQAQLASLNELYEETAADYDRRGFGSLRVKGFASGRNDDNQRASAGGAGFAAAVAAFDKSCTHFTDGGIQHTNVEFEWPLIAGGVKLSTQALATLVRSSGRAGARRITGILDSQVRSFLDDVAKNGYKSAVMRAGRQAFNRILTFKGQLAEATARRTLERAGYKYFPAKYGSNNGFDGVFVKFLPDGTVKDIIILESKFLSRTPALRSGAVLKNTSTMGRQLSKKWFEQTMNQLQNSKDSAVRATHSLLQANRSKIRLKVNVMDPFGINRWNRVRIPVWKNAS